MTISIVEDPLGIKNQEDIPSFIVGFGRPNYSDNDVDATPSAPVIPPFPGQVKPGDKGEAVEMIQHALTLVEDGDYGPATKKAVIAFQDNHVGLDSNGVVGPKTWDALMKTAL